MHRWVVVLFVLSLHPDVIAGEADVVEVEGEIMTIALRQNKGEPAR